MKLIRCHIENFGVLSDFDFTFEEGLTTICQSNGFGKSTFASFIKAMFYGFPRTGARNIVENERKRYDPWQGGKYGGYLEFETKGTSYRVTRYFGKTAAKDTFSLLDLTNRQSSTAYSEKLGEELFQLDADSFTRSTYVPQLSVRDMEATTSIRTKLSNLVDDTNDLSNYDTAESKLRDYRTKFRAYRGDGGIINKIRKTYLSMEDQKDQAEKKKPRLQEIVETIERLNGEKAAKTETVINLRDKIRLASDQKARRINQQRFSELHADIDNNQQYLQEMDKNYPAGYPTFQEIKEQRNNLSVIRQETQRLQALSYEETDRETVDREQQWFADKDKAASDIDRCDQACKELSEVSAKMTAQMLPEELEQLETLSVRFASNPPTEEDLQTCMAAADELSDAQLRQGDLSVPAENQKCLAQLKEMFSDGMPSDSVLAACEQAQHDCDVLSQSHAAHAFSESEQKQYEVLKHIFASSVPTEEEILDKQRDSRRITELTAKKNTQTTIVQQGTVQESSPSSKMPLLCGGIGIVFLVLGIVCFIMNFSAPGIIFLVIGFVALLVAFWMHTKSIVRDHKQSTASVITASAITDAENQELYNLQHALNDFLLRYYDNAAEQDNKLVQLLIDAKHYAELNEKKAAAENELKQVDAEIEKKNQIIREVFDQYFPNTTYEDDFIQKLRESRRKYQELLDEAQEVAEKRGALNEKIENCHAQIVPVLHKYYPVELPSDLRQGIRRLSEEVHTYRELKAKKQAMLKGNAEYQTRVDVLTEEIRGILLSYSALDQALPYDSCLRNLRKRLDGYREATDRLDRYKKDFESSSSKKAQADQSLEQFLLKYKLSGDTPENLIDYTDKNIHRREAVKHALVEAQDRLTAFLENNPGIEKAVADTNEDLPNLDDLQMLEKKIQKEIDDIDAELSTLRQERDTLRRSVENIPAWEDHIERLKAEEKDAEKKCSLIEQTMNFMSTAKDNLANSYVGKIERGFKYYAATLMGDRIGNVMVDKNLHLYIDEKGENREVGSFSAGTIDCIVLCMRLALVDALFGEEKPFLILDDPFINLDDAHTKYARELLDKIAETHQVVYMICNTSRQ